MMATIRTTLTMNDQMTKVIKNMSNALGASIHAFEQLNSASTNAVSTASIEAARRSLGALNEDITRLEQNLGDADQGQNGLNNSINNGANAMKGLVGAALGLVGAYVSLNGLKEAMNLADEAASNTARIAMMNDGLQTTAELQDAIFAASQRSLASYQDTVKLVGALGNRAGEAFSSNAETVKFAENLSKMFSIAGASQQEMASASLQLTQALGAGALRGEELNAVLEAAPNVIQAIAKEMDIPMGKIKDMAKDGLITADVVKKAMLNATDEIDAKFASMPTTFADAFTVFRNDALRTFEQVLSKMTEISNSKGFQNFLSGLASSLSTVASVASYVIDILVKGASFIYDNWWIIGPVLGTVTAAVVALGVALVAMQTYTMLATAAVWAMNAALWANPITWIVVAVIALVGAIYLAIGAINHFTGSSINATGVVAAAFVGLYTTIYNLFASLYNIFGAIAEYFINVWQNPIYSVKMLFFNLASAAIGMAQSMIGSFDSAATNLANMFVSAANTAIGAINAVIGALNYIPGVGIDKMGEVAVKKSVTADLSGLKGKINDWVGDKPSNYISVPKMANKSIPDAIANTYKNVSSKTSGGLGGVFDFGSGALADAMNSTNEAVKEGNKAGKDTAKNTKKTADKVGIASDDLKYMRDLSERDAINRYTTASIKLDVKNDLQVNSELDIDGLIDRFGEKLEESVESVAMGGVVFNV